MLNKEDICALLDAGDQRQEVDQYLHAIKYNAQLLDIECLVAILSHPKSTPSLIANALNTCGRLIKELAKTISFSKSTNTDPLKKKLVDLKQNHEIVLLAIEKHACQMSPLEIARSYWGLGYMEIHWETMTVRQQNILVNNLIHKAIEMPLKYLINTLWALARFKFPWKKLRKEIQQKLLDRISEDNSAIELDSMKIFLSTAARYGIFWSDLNEQLSAKLLHTIKVNEHRIPLEYIPIFLWALARMGITLSSPNNALIINLFKKYSKMYRTIDSLKEGHQRIIMAYYYFENRVPGLSFKVKDYLENHIFDTKSTSAIQQVITKQIKRALEANTGTSNDKDWIDEALIYGFRVDTFLARYGIILEIDGPHHAQWQQQLTDEFQNNLLAERGYTTIRVCITSYDKLDQKSKYELINDIVSAIIRPVQYELDHRQRLVISGLKLLLPKSDQAIKITLSNQALVDTITDNVIELNAQDIVHSLGILARRNIHWKNLSPELIFILKKSLLRDVCEMNNTEISETLLVLGQLNALWSWLEKPLQEKLFISLNANLCSMGLEDIYLCLQGLQQLKLSWHSLPLYLQKAVANIVVEKSIDTSVINFKRTFLALTSLMFTWQDLLEQQQTDLIKALTENTPFMSAENIADILHTLHKLEILKTHESIVLINLLFFRLQKIDTPTLLAPDKKQQITQAFYFFKPCSLETHFTVRHYEETSVLTIVNTMPQIAPKAHTVEKSVGLEKNQHTDFHDENKHPLGDISSKKQGQLPIRHLGLFEARAKIEAQRSSSPLSPQSSSSSNH